MRKKIASLTVALLMLLAASLSLSCRGAGDAPPVTDSPTGQMLRSTVAVLSEDREADGSLLSMADATGIVYDTDARGGAYIMTNYHVIAGTDGAPASHIYVSPYGHSFDTGRVAAEVVGELRGFDLALLYAEGISSLSSALTGVSFCEEPPRVGDPLYLTANTLGRGIGVLSGLLSVESEFVTYNFSYTDGPSTLREMRIDAAFYEGGSGGGVFDTEGRFCGLVNSRLALEGNAHMGYAIPSSVISPVCATWTNAHKAGKATPSLYTLRWGMTYQTAVEDVAWNGTHPVPQSTVTVLSLTPGSLGSLFLQEGDVITALTVNGTEHAIGNSYRMSECCYGVLPGDSVILHYVRGGVSATYSFTVQEAYLTPLA